MGQPYYRTAVGEFENSSSYYGTFDQGGNVTEWIDTIISNDPGRLTAFRGDRGGGYAMVVDTLAASYGYQTPPTTHHEGLGFRVASVPEPSSIALAVTCGVCLLASALRRRRV